MTTDRDDLIALDKFRRSGPKYKFSQAECELLDRVLERLRAQPTLGGWRPISDRTRNALEVLADEGLTLVHCAKCDGNSSKPVDEHSEECPRLAAREVLAALPPAPATEQTQEK